MYAKTSRERPNSGGGFHKNDFWPKITRTLNTQFLAWYLLLYYTFFTIWLHEKMQFFFRSTMQAGKNSLLCIFLFIVLPEKMQFFFRSTMQAGKIILLRLHYVMPEKMQFFFRSTMQATKNMPA